MCNVRDGAFIGGVIGMSVGFCMLAAIIPLYIIHFKRQKMHIEINGGDYLKVAVCYKL